MTRRRPVAPGPGFLRPPAPVGSPPYRRALADALPPVAMRRIQAGGAVRLHCVGDTGGWRDPRPQRRVAAAMVAQLSGPEPVDFLYHLGDVVYPHGEQAAYGSQFFSPYAAYRAPIFAVPGNHDGEVVDGNPEGSLAAFVKVFCSPSPGPGRDGDRRGQPRPAAGQPNVYWTLTHPWLWIVGLYTNVPEGGRVSGEQLRWLAGELAAAPPDATLILAMHHPVYSVDVEHGSNLNLGDALDVCFADAGRAPDAVLSGHAHNYQRFSRSYGGRSIPYLVAGSGGYYEPHDVGAGLPGIPGTFAGLPGVALEAVQGGVHGFVTVEAGPGGASAAYRTVSSGGRAEVRDRFRITSG